MNVFHLHTNDEWGGGEYQILNLLRRLPAHGVGAVLWTRPDGPLYDRALAAGIEARPLAGRSAAADVQRAVAASGTSLLHLHDSGAVSIGVRVARQAGLPAVYSRRITSPIRRNPLSRLKYSPGRLAAVLAISEAVRNVFLMTGYPAVRVHVVPSGLDLAELDAASRNDELRAAEGCRALVGGIGKLAPKKNWGLLIETAARLAHEAPGLRWAVVGDGPERGRLEALAIEQGVADRVCFTGFRADAPALLKSFDALFFPSIMEGAAVTVRQAMATGVPVVAADAAGTVESLGGQGWVIGHGDVEAAAAAVREILSGGATRMARCAAAKERARRLFDIEATVAGTVAVYRQVLAAWPG